MFATAVTRTAYTSTSQKVNDLNYTNLHYGSSQYFTLQFCEKKYNMHVYTSMYNKVISIPKVLFCFIVLWMSAFG